MAFGRRSWIRGNSNKTNTNGINFSSSTSLMTGSMGTGGGSDADLPQTGDLIVAGVVFDNAGDGVPTLTNMYADSSNAPNNKIEFGGSWVSPSATTSGGTSVMVGIVWGRAIANFASTTEVWAIFSNSIVAKGGAVTAFVDAADPIFDKATVMQYNSFTDWGSNVAHAAGDKIVIVLGSEQNSVFTTNTSSDQIVGAATTGGGSAANAALVMDAVTFVSTANYSYYPTTTTSDGGRIAVVIKAGVTLTPVTASRSTTWNTLLQVQANRNTTWNVNEQLTSVTASRSTTWNTRQQVTASRSTTWNTKQSVTASRSTTWNVLAEAALTPVTASRSTTWHTLAGVAPASRSTSWHTLSRIVGAGSPTVNDYNTDTGPSTTWITYTPPQGTVSIQFEVYGAFTDDHGVPQNGGYARGTLAYSGQTIEYQINSLIQDQDNMVNVVKINGSIQIGAGNGWDDGFIDAGPGVGWVQTVGPLLTDTYTETGTIAATQSHIKFTAYAAAAGVAARSTTWNTLLQVQANRNTTWNVAGTLAQVSASRSTTWHTRALVSTSRSTTWHTRAQVAAARSTSWHTRATVAASRSSLWHTRASITASRGSTWHTRAVVSTSRATTWNTLLQVQANRSTTWNVAGNLLTVNASRQTTWHTLARVTAERSTLWDTEFRITAARSTTWNTLRQLSAPAARSTTWHTRALVIGSRSTTWHTRAGVTALRQTSWHTRAAVSSSRATTWHTRALVTASRATTWHTLKFLVVARSTTWNTLQLVEATRATMWNVNQDGVIILWGVYLQTGWVDGQVMVQNDLGVWVPSVGLDEWNGTAWVPYDG